MFMTVELKKLELVNYRNIKHATYEFDGNSKIVGDNRIGKTNTLEAIVWLLTDKLLNGSSDIAAIKPLSDTRANVTVEGTFDINGKTVVIRKEYGEEWVKTRGTDEVSFKGHYLKYFYNGVRQGTKKDFYALFNEDFGFSAEFKGIDLVQLLVNPFYVGDLGEGDSWKDLREFIIKLIGDVSDDDVITKEPSLVAIKADLAETNGRIDQVKKMYQNSIKGIQEQIVGVDGMIQMLEGAEKPNENEVAIAKKGIKDIDEQIAKLQANKSTDAATIEISKEMNENQLKIIELKKADLAKNPSKELDDKLANLNDKYRNLLIEKSKTQSSIDSGKMTIETKNSSLKYCGEKREGFIKRLRELDEELSKPFDATCPTCGRPLEGEQLTEAIKKHQINLSIEKENILNSGRANKQSMEIIKEEIAQTEERIKDDELKLASILKDINLVLQSIEQTKKARDEVANTPIEVNPEIARLENLNIQLERKIKTIQVDVAAANVEINDKIEDLVAEKEKFQKVIDDLAYYNRNQEKLESTKLTKKDYEKELARFEQKKEMINTFMRIKLEMLDENVSKVFGNIKFQLIKENIKEGSFDAVCKPYIYDVDNNKSTSVSWKSGSKSERVITGVAICEKIKAALGLNDLPILFDEGGEISSDTFHTKFHTLSQLICVKVVDNITIPTVMKI